MALPVARTVAEAEIYIDLHPCEVCGESAFDPPAIVVEVDSVAATRYAGPCPRCGTAREFTFRLPTDEPITDPEEPHFGDERPSELLDPGQWLWLADRFAGNVPPAPDAGMATDDRLAARYELRAAAAAVAEALKFVPDGADAVPRESLWSATGRAVYAEEPGRFTRGRLEVVHRTYRELAERFTG